MSAQRRRHLRLARLCSFLLCGAFLASCSDKRSEQSEKNMKDLYGSIRGFSIDSGRWPVNLAEVKATWYGQKEERFSQLITNPKTGDKPGYEYVQPNMPVGVIEKEKSETTVLLYQLRNGMRDTNRPALFVDGSIRPLSMVMKK